MRFHPRKGGIRSAMYRLIDWSKDHPLKAALCSVAIVVVLLAIMYPMGLLPVHPQSPAPAGQAETTPRKAAKPHPSPREANPTVAPPALTGWEDRPGRHATDIMKNVDALLDSRSGVNMMVMREQISFIAVDPDCAYSRSESALMDAVKDATTRKPATPKEADSMCANLDVLHDRWQTQLWAAANEILDAQIGDTLLSEEDGRKVILSDKTAQASCREYAADDIALGGSGRSDYQRKLSLFKEHNAMQERCGMDMTPEQAERMPQVPTQ